MNSSSSINIKNEKQKDCFICLDTLNSSNKTIQLKCGHRFHYKCIKMSFDTNINKQKNCPYCRVPNGPLPNIFKKIKLKYNWEKIWCNNENKYFYYNKINKKKVWDKPTILNEKNYIKKESEYKIKSYLIQDILLTFDESIKDLILDDIISYLNSSVITNDNFKIIKLQIINQLKKKYF